MLRLNRDKSAVGHATSRTLLGFGFLNRGGEIKLRIDPKAHERPRIAWLRQVRRKEWKKTRTKHRNLIATGIPSGKAYGPTAAGGTGGPRGRGFSPAASRNAYWREQGLLGSATHIVAAGMRR